ncbi:MAG TPA: response regulator [Allosphingosinicella sp.]|jgi:two-component system response regulator FixJ
MSHQRTVYLIDGDVDSRRSTTRTLASVGAEAWPFSNAAEFLELLDHLLPACILVDTDAEPQAGLELLRFVAARQMAWPVIALSSRPDVKIAVEAMKLGARDYLEKPLARTELFAALSAAWPVLERSIRDADVCAAAQARVARLTPREVVIAVALLGGQGNKGVAHDLGISVRTVEMHRANLMAKLGARNLAEAAVIATQAGLLAATRANEAAPALLRPQPVRALPPSARRPAEDLLFRRAG